VYPGCELEPDTPLGSLTSSSYFDLKNPLLATSLFVDPAAELHEEASAGLGEHLAVPRLLDLAPVTWQPPRRAGMPVWARLTRSFLPSRGRRYRARGFVRQVKQLMGLLDQVAAVARLAVRAMRRGVVACSWAS
jgi:hypothetical protein